MINRYSLHKISENQKYPFDPSSYSWFKFGDRAYAETFAKELFEGFLQQFGDLLLEQEEVVILPSPYLAIPTASNFLCFSFQQQLNCFLYKNGKKAALESKIYRNQTYVTDYGNLGFEERIKLIANDTYYIDKEFIEGKFCLFLDDIKITGSHEHTVMKILDQYKVNGNFVFVYFAELMDSAIHPSIENHYNYYAVKGVDEIIDLLKRQSFQFNTRIIKYILSLKTEEFKKLMTNVSEERKRALFHLSISNNYHQIEEFKKNINFIQIT